MWYYKSVKGVVTFHGHKNIFVFLTQTIERIGNPLFFCASWETVYKWLHNTAGASILGMYTKAVPMTATFVKELYNEALVYSSIVFGMGFWIDEQGLFISAPEFKDGSLDIDNAVPVYDWENFDELSAHHLSHLMHVNQMCILKRDSQQLDYYAGVFANV